MLNVRVSEKRKVELNHVFGEANNSVEENIFSPLSFLFATNQKSNAEKQIATRLCLTKKANQNKNTGVLSFPAKKAEDKKISFFTFAKRSPNTLDLAEGEPDQTENF